MSNKCANTSGADKAGSDPEDWSMKWVSFLNEPKFCTECCRGHKSSVDLWNTIRHGGEPWTDKRMSRSGNGTGAEVSAAICNANYDEISFSS